MIPVVGRHRSVPTAPVSMAAEMIRDAVVVTFAWKASVSPVIVATSPTATLASAASTISVVLPAASMATAALARSALITTASQVATVMTIRSPVVKALSAATANVCAVVPTIRPVPMGRSVWRITASKAVAKMGNVTTASVALTIDAFTVALTTATVLLASDASITNVVRPARRTPVAVQDASAKRAYASMAAAKIRVAGIMPAARITSALPAVATIMVVTAVRPASKTIAHRAVSPMAPAVLPVMFAIAKHAPVCSV